MNNKCKSVFSLVLIILWIPVTSARAAEHFQIDYENLQQGHDGITRIERYSNLMIRDQGNILIKRLNRLPSDSYIDIGKHQHFDISNMSIWIAREPETKRLTIQLVDFDENQRIHLNEINQEILGFSNCWECYSSLLPHSTTPKNNIKNGHIHLDYNSQRDIVKNYKATHHKGYNSFQVKPLPTQEMDWDKLYKLNLKQYDDFSD
ncbi:hypothetical protein [Acinetobacter lwoffii]|uniref:hypothetical protein n=1 Tax=Acinetobacter lwoffii TaxID=28090 RepID=UPI0002CE27EB|nr:hypothetical protein [Acinetobacter lwoffii]ENW27478.1 hypothetical protein F924_02033 [Acinetobacter lwoffii ATCC 9957 = CIP 70.31]